jgi:hypothetical protein
MSNAVGNLSEQDAVGAAPDAGLAIAAVCLVAPGSSDFR